MKKFTIISLMAVILTAAFVVAQGSKDDTMKPAGSTMTDDKMAGDKMMLADEKDFYSTQNLQPRVVPFTSEADAQALAKTGYVVYFFAATWCPTCQATYKDLTKNSAKIPKDVSIVMVNYDTKSDLKKKYAITTQHTFVQINDKGEKIKVWLGSTTVEDIIKEISKK